MTDEQGFREWLIERGMGEKSARDVLSRCRRIERAFGLSLDKAVLSEGGLSNLTTRLQQEAGTYLKEGTNPTFGVSVVRRAAHLYAKYLSSQEAGLNR